MGDEIPDSNKTAQYRAMEAFLLTHQHQHLSADGGRELAGGAEPAMLHAVIASQPPLHAYKQVNKFRQHARYLEMMVHLVSATMAQGDTATPINWLADTFLWLSDRNKNVLSGHVHIPESHAHKKHAQNKPAGGSTRVKTPNDLTGRSSKVKFSQNKLNQQVTKNTSSNATMAMMQTGAKDRKPGKSQGGKRGRKSPVTNGDSTAKKATTGSCDMQKLALRKVQTLTGRAKELSQQLVITREDLEVKSTFVLMTQLSVTWHTHKHRYTPLYAHTNKLIQ